MNHINILKTEPESKDSAKIIPLNTSFKINQYECFTKPTVTSTIPVEEWFEMIKYSEYSDKIIEARNSTKKLYDQTKSEIPCVTYNFLFDGYKNDKNIISATGLLYIDVDHSDFDVSILDANKVFARYRSFGGIGYAVIVRVAGLTPLNFKSTYSEIIDCLGITDYADKNAMKATQFSVLSFDPFIYVNPDPYTFTAIQTAPMCMVIDKTLKKNTYTLDTGAVSDKIYFNNLHHIKIPDGEKHIVNWDGYDVINCGIAMHKISEGKRKHFLLSYCNNLVYLNPQLTKKRTIQLMSSVNSYACANPLSFDQVLDIVRSIFRYKDDGTLKPKYSSKKRKIVFAVDSGLTRSEKLNVCRTERSKKTSNDSRHRLYLIIEEWDFYRYGKISQRKISRFCNMNRKTVEKYYHEFKDYIISLNESSSVPPNALTLNSSTTLNHKIAA